MLPFRTGDRIFCLLCGGNRLLIHSKSIQRYPIYFTLHKILDGTFKRDLKILNPYLVSKEQAERIKDKFSKLKKRGTLPLLEDLNCGIRKEFDDVVLRAFGIEKYKEQMERSLKNLYNIRKSVCQNN